MRKSGRPKRRGARPKPTSFFGGAARPRPRHRGAGRIVEPERLELRVLLAASPPPDPSDWVSLNISAPVVANVTNDSNENGIDDTLETRLLNMFDPMIAPPGVDNTTPISIAEFLSRSGIYVAAQPTPGANPANALLLDTPSLAQVQSLVDSGKYSSYRSDGDYYFGNNYPYLALGVHNVDEPDKAALWANAKIYARAAWPQGFPAGVFVLQYYWLYIQNATGESLGDRDGDIVSVDLTVDTRGSSPTVDGAIYENHGRQLFVQPDAMQFSGTHPVVYTEEGTNEAWPNSGIGGFGGWPAQGVTTNQIFEGGSFFGVQTDIGNEDDVDHDHWGGDNSAPDPSTWHLLPVVNLGNVQPGTSTGGEVTYYPFAGQSAEDAAEAELFSTFPGSWGNTHLSNPIVDSDSPRGPYFDSSGKYWDRSFAFGQQNPSGSSYSPLPDPSTAAPSVVDSSLGKVQGTVVFGTAVRVSATAEIGSTITVFVDGTSYVAIPPAGGPPGTSYDRGLYTCDLTGLSEGSHEITVTSTNWSGMAGAQSAPLSVFVAPDEIPVASMTGGDQANVSVAIDAVGAFVAVWQSADSNGTVYAQQYNATGQPQGSEIRVAGGNGPDAIPSVAMDSAGAFVVVWQSADADGSGIYARQFGSDGAPGPIFLVNAAGAGERAFARVAMDAVGDYGVVWQSEASGAAGWTVKGRWYTAAGIATTAEIALSAGAANDERLPAIAMDLAGDAVVTWASQRAADTAYDVVGRRFTAAGVARDGANLVVDLSADQPDASPPMQFVAMDRGGDFVAAWTASDGDGHGIFARQFAASGAPLGSRFLVNARGTVGEQFYPSVSADDRGDFVVAWQTADRPPSGVDVYASWYDPAGNLVGGGLVNEYMGQQTAPKVALGPQGDIVVAWQSSGEDGSGWGVYARRYVVQPAANNVQFRPTTTVSGDQTNASVASDMAGDFVVVWQGVDGSGTVYGQQYNQAGQPQGFEIRIAGGNGADAIPSVAMDSAGDFVVAWQSVNADGSGIYARLYASNGVPVGSVFEVNATGAGERQFARVAMDASGDFVVVWQSESVGAQGWTTLGRWYTAGGTAATAEVALSAVAANDERLPSVAMDPAGETTVVWASQSIAGANYDVLARRFTKAGVARDSANLSVDLAADQPDGTPPMQFVTMDGSGNFVAAWTAADGDGHGIFARRYAASGAPLGNRSLVNARGTAGEQFYPSVSADGEGDYVVAWQTADRPAGGTDVYASWYNSGGTLIGGGLVNQYMSQQSAPKVALDPTGDIVLAWQSWGQDGSGWGIAGKRVGSAFVGHANLFTSTTLTLSANPIAVGGTVTLVARVSSAGAPPSGTVIFTDGTAVLGAAVLDSTGSASLSLSDPSEGLHNLGAEYEGDDSYFGSDSSLQTLDVTGTQPLGLSGAVSNLGSAALGGAHGSAVLRVTNSGSIRVSGLFNVDLLASSPLSGIDLSGPPLASLKGIRIGLGAHRSTALRFRWAYPTSLPSGTYSVVAVIRDARNAGQVESIVPGPEIQLNQPFVDLAIQSVMSPVKLTPKRSATIRVVIANLGNAPAKGLVDLDVLTSLDQTPITATEIQSATRSVSLQPGKKRAYSVPLRVTSTLAAGTYYIGTQITSVAGLADRDLLDNVAFSASMTLLGQ